MSNIFKDGFDHYPTLAQKWTTVVGASINASGARTGGFGASFGSSDSIAKAFAVADQHATMIVGAAIKVTAVGLQFQFWGDGVITQHVTVSFLSSGTINVYRGSIAGTLLGTVAAAFTPANFSYAEVKVLLSDTVGTVQVWINGVSVLSLTAQDTKNAGTATVFDGIKIVCAAVGSGFCDDVYVNNGAGTQCNSNLGDVKVLTLLPTVDGNHRDLVGVGTVTGAVANTYQNVDESVANITDYNASSTDEQYDLYEIADLPAGVLTVHSISTQVSALKSDAGNKGLAVMVRSGGTNYDLASIALATSIAVLTRTDDVDPATSAAWTTTNVNAMQAGGKVKAA